MANVHRLPHLLTLAVLVLGVAGASSFVWKHHNNDELLDTLVEVHSRCPNNTRVYTLSETSVRGVPLYVIELGPKPGHHQPRECRV